MPATNLSQRHLFDLRAYVKENFTAAGKSDAAFAKQAAEHLGYKVTPVQVFQARQIFGIEAIGLKKPKDKGATADQRLDALEVFQRSCLSGVDGIRHRLAKLEELTQALGDQLTIAQATIKAIDVRTKTRA